MKNQFQKGFTLIELMIVVAIIGILAAVGLPAYQDYTIRAQVSEGPVLSGGLKTAISEYYSDRGQWPASNTTLGISAVSGSYVSSVTSSANVITVTYSNTAPQRAHANINGSTVAITGSDATDSIKWACTTGGTNGVPSKYLPSSCK